MEVFEADLWGGGQVAEADLLSLAGVACNTSHAFRLAASGTAPCGIPKTNMRLTGMNLMQGQRH